MAQKFLVRLGDDEAAYEVQAVEGRFQVRRDEGEWLTAELARVGDADLYLLMLDNHPTELYIERRRGGATVTIARHTFNCDVGAWRPGAQRGKRSGGAAGLVRINAPMTGSVVEVRCQPGDEVHQGQVLLVIESMKMNNELRSPAAGIVESVPVVAGQRVKAQELLVALRTG